MNRKIIKPSPFGPVAVIVDRWHLFYNGGTQFHDVALGEGESVEVRDEELFGLFLRIVGDEVV